MEGLHPNIHVAIPFRERTGTEPEFVPCRILQGQGQMSSRPIPAINGSLLGYRDIVQLGTPVLKSEEWTLKTLLGL